MPVIIIEPDGDDKIKLGQWHKDVSKALRMLWSNITNANGDLNTGDDDDILTFQDGVPTWLGKTEFLTNNLLDGVMHLDTAVYSATNAGSIIYSSTDSKWHGLAAGSEGQILKIASGIPAWDSVDDVPTVVADTYIILVTDETVICNKASAFTVTLPAGIVGQKFTIKNIGAGTVTLEGDASDTIDGSLNQLIYQWESIQVQCYANNSWVILMATRGYRV